MNLVLLPATDPEERRYGVMPERLDAFPTAVLHHVRFQTMVWYNTAVRENAVAQIEAFGLSSLVLIGFSKSGLGAWNIARALPERVAATVIFDAPVTLERRPGWKADDFYADDAAWQADLPCRLVTEFKAAMPATHKLILISGAAFHPAMARLSSLLADALVPHTFLARPAMPHHWQAGWIDEALGIVMGPPMR